jgi:hypothetical protein
MSHLKSLTFCVTPEQVAQNPRLVRRQRLIDKLEEQQRLSKDPDHVVVVKRASKDADGNRIDTARTCSDKSQHPTRADPADSAASREATQKRSRRSRNRLIAMPARLGNFTSALLGKLKSAFTGPRTNSTAS